MVSWKKIILRNEKEEEAAEENGARGWGVIPYLQRERGLRDSSLGLGVHRKIRLNI